MDRNLALELVRVTEAAALVSSQFMGRGDKNGADGAAVEAMRRAFESVKIKGEVVIGEGEIDEAPMLYIGEKVGSQEEGTMEVDIAVDPLDGTELIAKGLPNAISFRLFYRIKRKFKTLLFHRYQILRQYTRSAGSRTYSCLFGIQMYSYHSVTLQFINVVRLL